MSTPTFGRKRRPAWKAAGDAFGGAKLADPTSLKKIRKKKKK
jgi:hypothetical protein